MAKSLKPAGRAPGFASLQERAMRHLSRFASTEAGLMRVLDRSVQRWATAAKADGKDVEEDVASARSAVRQVVASLAKAGIVDDAVYAAARARRLMRAGRSRRATASHLASKGIRSDVAEMVLPNEDQELPSALTYARRRRIGPFRLGAVEDAKMRDLATLARAGFSRAVAERALAMDAEAAEAIVLALRQS